MFHSNTFVSNIVHSNKWIASQLTIMMSQPKRRKQNVCVLLFCWPCISV